MALQNHALVVGINRYPVLGSLAGAEADASDFFTWVTDPGGGAADPSLATLILSAPGNSEKVSDSRPARMELERFFANIDELATKNNEEGLGLKAGKRLYIFLSGHGFSPAFERSALVMPNSTRSVLDSFAGREWAERIYRGGWFDEVILFQDACRNAINSADLMPPTLARRDNPGTHRFYAFAAKDGKLAIEKTFSDGRIGGIFTLTLMEGLRGAARDPLSGDITSARLKGYLMDNMRLKLSAEELINEENARVPDIYDPDPLVIVKSQNGNVGVRLFPVQLKLKPGDFPSSILNSKLKVIARNNGERPWSERLPIGLYALLVPGRDPQTFEVTGALRSDGSEEIINVSLE
jgi:hypothetical protein